MSKVYFNLAGGSFTQDWTDPSLITTDDNWAGVPSIEGYRGDDITSSTGVDPRTLLGDGTITLDVNANQTNPNTFTAGGVAEFAITNPTIALNGSGTADAPYIVVYLNATGRESIHLELDVRDLDGSVDNSIQQVNVQYRVGEAGNWANVTGGYIADATTGPSLATLVTHLAVDLPAAANGAAQLQVRIMTTNAVGNDEWVGLDNIVVTSAATQGPPTPSVNLSVSSNAGTETGTTVITVTATASAAVTGAQTVNLAVTGTGITAGDYTLSGTVITIPNGGTFGTVTFTVVDDAVIEGNETAVLTISGPSAGILLGGVTTQNIVITDNDIPAAIKIHDIQGAAHLSPLRNLVVTNVPGIVTAVDTNGFYLQDPDPDANLATSEGIFVFTSSAPTVVVGDSVTVSGTVSEFRSSVVNLSTTEITTPTVVKISSGNALPAAVVLGADRTIPTQFIENDPGSAETGTFDPAVDGIDFWESLEGMRLVIYNPVTTSPTIGSNELWVLADNGTNATSLTAHGGSLITATDYNPERIKLYAGLPVAATVPVADVGAQLSNITGVLAYGSGNYEVHPTAVPTVMQASTLTREVTALLGSASQLTVATFNAENLDPGDGATKFNNLAAVIVNNLKSPDIVNLEEIQDNNGAGGGGGVDVNLTMQALINAIIAAGGPAYQYRQISPLDGTNGGEPGGNIRVVFMYNTARVDFVDRPGGTSTSNTTVSNVGGQPQLSASPGLVDPTNSAFSNSRKPLVGEFTFNGDTVFVIGNHFVSKGGDQPLFGVNQPPVLSSETGRVQQATIVKNFVQSIQAINPAAKVLVAGDLNDFEFSNPNTVLESAGLTSLIETLPANERFSYNFQGNAQTIDHLMASASLTAQLAGYDVVHVNSEFAVQVSDHDPALARFSIAQPTVTGTAGRDVLAGGAGHSNDIITGLQGRDVLVGGAGADKFVYTSLIDFFDVVVDFEVGVDKLDVKALLQTFPQGTFSAGKIMVATPYFAQPLLTVVSFDPDGPGIEEARPMVQLVGVDATNLGVVLETGGV